MSEVLDNLEYEDYEDPVVLDMKGDTILPGVDVWRMLENKHNVPREKHDEAQVWSPQNHDNHEQISFDAGSIDDKKEAIKDIETMIENYNNEERPPDVPDEEEWPPGKVEIKFIKK